MSYDYSSNSPKTGESIQKKRTAPKVSISSSALQSQSVFSNSPRKKPAKLRKLKSRISNAVEKTVNQELNLDDEERSTSVNSAEEQYESSQQTLVNVNVVISESVKTISIIVNSKCKIASLVNRSITDFNKEFEKEKVPFRLNSDPDNYVLKPAKKKGFPKVDMPYFNSETTVAETDTSNFAICWKDDPNDFKVMFEINRKKAQCQGKCIIF